VRSQNPHPSETEGCGTRKSVRHALGGVEGCATRRCHGHLRSEGDISGFIRIRRNILNRWREDPLDNDAPDCSHEEENDRREEQEKHAAQSQHRANDYCQDVTTYPPSPCVGFGNHKIVSTIRTTEGLRYIYPSVLQP
jgi:hypothetical protein